MAIKHDAQGFLIGDLLESSKEMLDAQQTGIGIWRGIRRDVSAIARALGTSARTGSQGVHPASEPTGRGTAVALNPRNIGEQVAAAVTRSRGADGRFSAATPLSRSTIKAAAEESRKVAVTTGNRDQRTGRFGAGSGGDTPDRDGGTSFLADKLGKAADAFKGAATGAENIDPSITALSEVKAVLEPFGRGAFALFGRNPERKKERWYTRFLAALNKRNDPTVVSSGGDGGGGGMLATLFRLFGPLVAAIGAAILPVIAATGTAIVAMAPVLAPILGAAIAAAVAAWLAKKAVEALAPKVKEMKDNYNKGEAETYKPPGSNNAHRQMEAGSTKPLEPSSSLAQSAGRAKGRVKNALQDNFGYKPMDASNDPTGRLGKSPEAVRSRREALVKQMDASGITDPNERAAFMAQTHHESGGFKNMEEIGSASYLSKYDGRKDLGNNQPGDGARFKGRGFMQLTGRANYRDMGNKLGIDLEKDPELAKNPEIAAKIATQFWQDRSRAKKFGGGKISDLAKAGNIDGVTQGVNGGMNGAQDRRDLYASYLKSGIANAGAKTLLAQPRTSIDKNGLLSASSGTTVTAGLPSVVSPTIPPSLPARLPASPEVTIPPLSSSEKDKPVAVATREPIGQNMADRQIAHIVSGGIGSNGTW